MLVHGFFALFASIGDADRWVNLREIFRVTDDPELETEYGGRIIAMFSYFDVGYYHIVLGNRDDPNQHCNTGFIDGEEIEGTYCEALE